jgi:hypothetical protein
MTRLAELEHKRNAGPLLISNATLSNALSNWELTQINSRNEFMAQRRHLQVAK